MSVEALNRTHKLSLGAGHEVVLYIGTELIMVRTGIMQAGLAAGEARQFGKALIEAADQLEANRIGARQHG